MINESEFFLLSSESRYATHFLSAQNEIYFKYEEKPLQWPWVHFKLHKSPTGTHLINVHSHIDFFKALPDVYKATIF